MDLNLSTQTKTLLFVALVVLLIYFLNNYSSQGPFHNEGSLDMGSKNLKVLKQMAAESEGEQVSGSDEDSKLQNKMLSRNSSRKGYRKSDYVSGERASNKDTDNLDTYFNDSNAVLNPFENDGFRPANDNGTDNLAPYKAGKQRKSKDEDLYNADDYLPQEMNDSWFEVPGEAVSVKNRHLINVSKPIGVDTVGSSHRNASWDIRGAIPTPRTVVSPWLQSSIEPDVYDRGLCN